MTSKVAFGKFMIDQTEISVETAWPKVKDKQVEAWSGIKLKETCMKSTAISPYG